MEKVHGREEDWVVATLKIRGKLMRKFCAIVQKTTLTRKFFMAAVGSSVMGWGAD
jgi:hypothetical protein